jgi:predicted anti-sigma-YlaC factor YlaD
MPMSEDTYKPLLMGYLDGELTELESLRMERHLENCPDCRGELEDFRRLKEATLQMKVFLPEDKYWEEYWAHIYNRLERRFGWILFSLGAIMLSSFGLYKLVTHIFTNDFSIFVRVSVIALLVGFSTLMISVIRERLFLIKSDKYERIKR